MISYFSQEPFEGTFHIEDADLQKMVKVLNDVNIKECPYFDLSDKYGNSARYYRENQWIPFHKRELTEEEQEMYPGWSYYLDCELPEDGEEIIISSPTWGVYIDTFNNEGSEGCYLEGDEEIDDGMAWMPLPEPYKEGTE